MAGLQAAARGVSVEQAYQDIAASVAANRLGARRRLRPPV